MLFHFTHKYLRLYLNFMSNIYNLNSTKIMFKIFSTASNIFHIRYKLVY